MIALIWRAAVLAAACYLVIAALAILALLAIGRPLGISF